MPWDSAGDLENGSETQPHDCRHNSYAEHSPGTAVAVVPTTPKCDRCNHELQTVAPTASKLTFLRIWCTQKSTQSATSSTADLWSRLAANTSTTLNQRLANRIRRLQK